MITVRHSKPVYDPVARFYDLDHEGFDDDLALYRDFARTVSGPILDVGVGTGRVALALASEGATVTGIDVSPAMLALAATRVRLHRLENRVTLVLTDVRTLDMANRFGLSYFALNTFAHLLAPSDQLAALRAVRRHLLPGGRLLVDQWNPLNSSAPDSSGQWVLGYRRQGRSGSWVTQSVATVADPAEQLLSTTIVYDEEVLRSRPTPHRRATSGTELPVRLARTAVSFKLRYHYRFEVEWLLLSAGFEVEATFGDYDLSQYSGISPRLISLARRVDP